MKRATAVIGAMVVSATMFLMVTAGTATAACNDYPPKPNCVEAAGDSNNANNANNVVKSAGDTAFTGGDVSMWMVLLGVLIVAGVATLMIARRRSAATHSE
ncbi:MAG: LPXTG cell wall anchor domain-containing protein [Actinomycetota bacterium]